MNKTKILQVIENVHMGLGHQGLALLCKTKFKLDLNKLEDGTLVMFINRDKNKLKIIGHQGIVLGYLRMPHERKIMMEAIQYLPQTFGATGWNYDEALKKALESRLVQKTSSTKVGPLQLYRAMERAGLTART